MKAFDHAPAGQEDSAVSSRDSSQHGDDIAPEEASAVVRLLLRHPDPRTVADTTAALAEVRWRKAHRGTPQNLVLASLVHAADHLQAGVGDLEFWAFWCKDRCSPSLDTVADDALAKVIEAVEGLRRGRKSGDAPGPAYAAIAALFQQVWGERVEPDAIRKRVNRLPPNEESASSLASFKQLLSEPPKPDTDDI